MRFAYADPPYVGQARKHYSADPNAREVNHRLLIGWLCADFDAWALSMSATLESFAAVLPHCPREARIGAWVKPFASFKPGVNPAYAWEPVVFWGGRKRERSEPTVWDWVAANITLQRGLSGAKPTEFCWWVFDLLGAEPDDSLLDVFPGSGAVSAAWAGYCARSRLKRGEPMAFDLEAS